MRKALAMAVVICVLVIAVSMMDEHFLSLVNFQNTVRQIAMLALFAIGAGLVIIAGGIDLSTGSWIALSGVIMVRLLMLHQLPVPVAVFLVMAISAGVGVIHGLLVTKARIQPFVVTLCGLLIYRGIARFVTEDETQGLRGQFVEFSDLANGMFLAIPQPAWIVLGVALITGIFLHTTRYGRYLYAIGRNPEAARLSGINVHGFQILTYAIATLLAGMAGMLYTLYTSSVQPATAGTAYELYAIAAAVLGGCSLRGGEGTIIGILLGACVIRLLYNIMPFIGISTFLEYAIIGAVILIAVMADEFLRRKEPAS